MACLRCSCMRARAMQRASLIAPHRRRCRQRTAAHGSLHLVGQPLGLGLWRSLRRRGASRLPSRRRIQRACVGGAPPCDAVVEVMVLGSRRALRWRERRRALLARRCCRLRRAASACCCVRCRFLGVHYFSFVLLSVLGPASRRRNRAARSLQLLAEDGGARVLLGGHQRLLCEKRRGLQARETQPLAPVKEPPRTPARHERPHVRRCGARVKEALRSRCTFVPLRLLYSNVKHEQRGEDTIAESMSHART